MARDDAKERFQQAQELCNNRRFEEAWEILDALYRVIPESRRLVFQRALCLIGLNRIEDAEECCAQLEGKLEEKHIQGLRDQITAARRAAEAVESGGNVFMVETVFSNSSDETTVTGHVGCGAFYQGDSVSLISSTGLPVLAPIVRIGTAEVPLKMVRQGQQTIMVLKVEPHHVLPGIQLTSTATSSSYAETVVVTAQEDETATLGARAAESDPVLREAEMMLAERRVKPAIEKLAAFVEAQPSSCTAHRLLGRAYLEGGRELRDARKALEHAKRAFELGGGSDPVVIETLAYAMGANDEAAHGLRFLEQVYTLVADDEARKTSASRIDAYRARYKLGSLWQFVDGFGNVIFESSSVEEIYKAITKGNVSKNAQCRKNNVGDWMPIEDSLALEYPEIAALYRKPKNYTGAAAAGGALAGFVVGYAIAVSTRGMADMTFLLQVAIVVAAIGGTLGAVGGMAFGGPNPKVPGK